MLVSSVGVIEDILVVHVVSFCDFFAWFFFFIFLLPSALPHPIHMYSFEMLWPDTSYIIVPRLGCTTASTLWTCIPFFLISFEPLINYPTMAPKKNPVAASKASTATLYELLHYYYRATLLMPGVSAIPEVAPLKGLPNRLSCQRWGWRSVVPSVFLLFNLTIISSSLSEDDNVRNVKSTWGEGHCFAWHVRVPF